jgi:hypothetical protein
MQPGAQQRPEAFHSVDVDLAEPVAIVIAGILAGAVADRLVAIAPGAQAGVDVVFISVDQRAATVLSMIGWIVACWTLCSM